MLNEHQKVMGSLSGTDKNHDRAEVWATDPQGTQVKIFDDYVPFRTYN